jgi:hypothetical protein
VLASHRRDAYATTLLASDRFSSAARPIFGTSC